MKRYSSMLIIILFLLLPTNGRSNIAIKACTGGSGDEVAIELGRISLTSGEEIAVELRHRLAETVFGVISRWDLFPFETPIIFDSKRSSVRWTSPNGVLVYVVLSALGYGEDRGVVVVKRGDEISVHDPASGVWRYRAGLPDIWRCGGSMVKFVYSNDGNTHIHEGGEEKLRFARGTDPMEIAGIETGLIVVRMNDKGQCVRVVWPGREIAVTYKNGVVSDIIENRETTWSFSWHAPSIFDYQKRIRYPYGHVKYTKTTRKTG